MKKESFKIENIPPVIIQHFSSALLSYSCVGIKESKSFQYLYEEAIQKYGPNSRQMRDFNELLEINEKLYEWKKSQEAYFKTENEEIAKRPVIPFGKINKCRGFLGKELRGAFKKIHDT
jgi:hypothetical protein